MWTRAELKENAKKFFKYNYWKMVLVSLVLSLGGGGTGGSVSYSNSTGKMYSSDGSIHMPQLTAFLLAFMGVFLAAMVFGLALRLFLFNPLHVGALRCFVVITPFEATYSKMIFCRSSANMALPPMQTCRFLCYI